MAESTPLQFDVPGMTSRSSANSICRAIREVDGAAHIVVDFDSKRVMIGSAGTVHDFMAAIEAAGYKVHAAD